MADEPSNMPAAEMLVTESRRLLIAQGATLEALRTRAIAMLSVAALVAGFFGSRLSKHLTAPAYVAIAVAVGTFGGSVILVASIVRPIGIRDTHSLARQYGKLFAGAPLSAYNLATTWAKGYEEDRHANEEKIHAAMGAFAWVCYLVAAQVIAWTIAVMG